MLTIKSLAARVSAWSSYNRPHIAPGPDPYSSLVYAARGSDVRATIVDGVILMDDFKPVRPVGR